MKIKDIVNESDKKDYLENLAKEIKNTRPSIVQAVKTALTQRN